jgi:hypothetical protein
MSEQVRTFEGYHYRTGSRFGSRVRLSIESDNVTVTGVRVRKSWYQAWIGAQAALLAMSPVMLLLAIVRWNRRYLKCAGALFTLYLGLSGGGAGCLWEEANLEAFGAGKVGDTVSFPLEDVRDVRIGRGWDRGGLGLVILPFLAAINKMSEGYAVSFEAPDGEGGKAIYALHMRTPADARALAAALER